MNMAAVNMSDIPIIILAAGASRRMQGRDKLMEPVTSKTLLSQQIDNACRASTRVIVTLPPYPHPRYDVVTEKNVETVTVSDAAEGISASLRAGLRALPASVPAAMVLLADLPDLTCDDFRAILTARQKHPASTIWRGTTQAGKPGHPILFAAVHFPALMALSGDQGASRLISAHADAVTLVKLPGDNALRDLDTPEDWAAWRLENAIPH